MLVPSLAWGQTVDEMKQMLQQLLEQNKSLQQRVEKLEDLVKDLKLLPFDKKNVTFSRGQQDTFGVELYYQF